MRCSALFVSCLVLTGCVGSTEAPEPIEKGPDGPEAIIATSFQHIERAVSKLETIQRATDKVRLDEVIYAPKELHRKIKYYEYTPGLVERIVQDLAEQAGYRFAVIGNAPVGGVRISVKWKNIEIIDALRDVGVKTGNKAAINVDPRNARIEVIYDR